MDKSSGSKTNECKDGKQNVRIMKSVHDLAQDFLLPSLPSRLYKFIDDSRRAGEGKDGRRRKEKRTKW